MLARLGDVLYWAGSGIAVLASIAFLLVALGAFSNGGATGDQ
jgi:hypothetical protein